MPKTTDTEWVAWWEAHCDTLPPGMAAHYLSVGRERRDHAPSAVGDSVTIAIIEGIPTQGKDGRWWKTWAPDGPPKYWLDGREITLAEFKVLADV